MAQWCPDSGKRRWQRRYPNRDDGGLRRSSSLIRRKMNSESEDSVWWSSQRTGSFSCGSRMKAEEDRAYDSPCWNYHSEEELWHNSRKRVCLVTERVTSTPNCFSLPAENLVCSAQDFNSTIVRAGPRTICSSYLASSSYYIFFKDESLMELFFQLFSSGVLCLLLNFILSYLRLGTVNFLPLATLPPHHLLASQTASGKRNITSGKRKHTMIGKRKHTQSENGNIPNRWKTETT